MLAAISETRDVKRRDEIAAAGSTPSYSTVLRLTPTAALEPIQELVESVESVVIH